MAKQLGFYFNSSACTGCKACQVACKDKNDLEVGLLWRRVYEVSGGDWEEREGVYRNSVFAYNISMACNHCEKPECVYKCPTNALQKDKKRGIVSIDPELCIGCRYCEWNCPYGAPQYDKNNGVMTKCDFCSDYLEQGKAPACVDACPMRALDFGEIGALRKKYRQPPGQSFAE